MNTPAATRLGRAWVLFCAAIALHVLDEALTGFLGVYNPTVLALRERWSWFPMPVFEFGDWLAGLIVGIVLLLSLSVVVYSGAGWIRPVAYFLAALMILNGLGHTLGTVFGRTVESVRFARPMPGFYSSPFLIAAAVYLLWQLRKTRQALPAA
ncbi:MAG: hypothetical protein ACRD5I_06345 [Candidatus Acidiferrales bacterium]